MRSSFYDRAAVIPGRSLTRSKNPDQYGAVWADGDWDGAHFWADGQQYLDLKCALGARSLGYRPGGVGSVPHVLEIEAAEAVLEHVAPWASHVRFTKTGTEATLGALMIAQQATGRTRYLRLRGSYHGWHTVWSERAEYAEWIDVGEPIRGDWSRYAAVVIEPPRNSVLDLDWLGSVRHECRLTGALLIFDSMIYGGRFALGGASEYFRLTPDLECFGKAFGNGESVAFIVGREVLAEHGSIVSGTFSGDITGLMAVRDTLHTYTTEPVIETIWARGRQLQQGLRGLVPLSGEPPLLFLTWDSARRQRFRQAMQAFGIWVHPDWLMPMYAHTERQIADVIEAAEHAWQMMQN